MPLLLQFYRNHSNVLQWISLGHYLTIGLVSDMCSTRHTESMLLHSTDASHVAEKLIGVLARVGYPKNTNRSRQQFYVTAPNRTKPYHPQTDVLVVDIEEYTSAKEGMTGVIPTLCLQGSSNFPLLNYRIAGIVDGI